ncbi:SEC-C metal-binding domain-containing protein [Glaciecola punicea]
MLHKSGAVTPSRNDTCLCGSGKKFKRCCLA